MTNTVYYVIDASINERDIQRNGAGTEMAVTCNIIAGPFDSASRAEEMVTDNLDALQIVERVIEE